MSVYAHFRRSPIIIMQMNSSIFASACNSGLYRERCCPRRQRTQVYAPRTKSAENTSNPPRNKRGKNQTMHGGKTLYSGGVAACQAYLQHTRHGKVTRRTFFLQKPLESVVLFSCSKLKQKVRSTSFISAGPCYNSQQSASARDNIPFAGVIVVGTKTHTSRYVEQQRTSLQLSLRRWRLRYIAAVTTDPPSLEISQIKPAAHTLKRMRTKKKCQA